jgi:hypothetical protein
VPTSPTQFAPMWAFMLAAWPGAKLEPGTNRAYAATAADFEPAEVAAAVAELHRRSTFFPSTAEVWRAALARRDHPPSWEQAWREAEAHAEGTDQAWSHPAVREAARAISLWEIATSTAPATVRAQFRDTYRAICERRLTEYAAGVRELPAPGELPALPAAPVGSGLLALPVRIPVPAGVDNVAADG